MKTTTTTSTTNVSEKLGTGASPVIKPLAIRSWACLCAASFSLGASALLVQAGQRPLADFTTRQGAYCLKLDSAGENIDCAASAYGGGGCFVFVPPQPNVSGWADPKTSVFALVDYAGLANQAVGGAFGTTLDGSVNEVPLADGRAEVSVLLHTRNALIWASDTSSSFPGPLLFGHRLDEIMAGAAPALGESQLQLTFINTAPGAALPDLIQLIFCPVAGQELKTLSGRAQADGLLPNGARGRLEMVQTGLITISGIANPHSRVALDAFPAEKIVISGTGK